jgi:hypothetical protein
MNPSLMVIALVHWLTILNLIDPFLTIIALVRSGSETAGNTRQDKDTAAICCIWVTLNSPTLLLA